MVFIIAQDILTVDQITLFLIFFIPGFVAVQVYDLFVPRERRDWQNAFFEVVAYSALNFVAIAGLIAFVSAVSKLEIYIGMNPPEIAPLFWLSALSDLRGSLYEAQGAYYFLLLFVVLLGMPAFLSFLLYKLQMWAPVSKHIHITPMPTPWDEVFSYSKLAKNKHGYYLIIYLKSRQKIGGFYGEGSTAARYPYPHQIFLERQYEVNNDGTFGDPISGSVGVLVSGDEIESIEFIKPEKSI
jgi:uncharacterized membrane protein